MQGTIRPGMKVKMMATGAEFQVVETGYMRPLTLEATADGLTAGEVGYFTASIKNVTDTRVGDTVTGVENPAPKALPGYRKVQPMVFSGIYPADGSKYPDLRDALEKLQLNDASLTFEPESSVALGFGFRCGFLGLLHMEIIQERLEREYDLDLITTAPSVIYKIKRTDGEEEYIDNPLNYPDPTTLDYAEEPYVKASIMTPSEYVGNIMELCQERRGIYKDMEYIDSDRVEMHYELPLGEIIYDFFDALKSRTRGYASLDYELIGYRKSELVKLDLLLNGDPVDALSFIVHTDKAYARARKHCRKAQGEHSASDVRNSGTGSHWQQDYCPRNHQGDAQGRSRQVLRRRYYAKEKAAGEAKGRQKAHACARLGTGAAGSLHGRTQAG